MREVVEGGRLLLAAAGDGEPSPVLAIPPEGSGAAACMAAVQVVGRAGDVVLMHPLLVHGGTMNLHPHTPRLMANGVARTTVGAFAAGGCPMMRIAAAAAAVAHAGAPAKEVRV